MIFEHYPSFAIADILKSRKHKPKFVDVYIVLIPRLSFLFVMNCQWDLNDKHAWFESIVVDTMS